VAASGLGKEQTAWDYRAAFALPGRGKGKGKGKGKDQAQRITPEAKN
jgi:hypothetical protein